MNCGGSSDFEDMTSNLFNQSFGRHCLLTTLTFTRTISLRHSKYLHIGPTITRTFTLSYKNKFERSQPRLQSNISKGFPEAMEAIKQTVAQNMGIGVGTFCALQWILKLHKHALLSSSFPHSSCFSIDCFRRKMLTPNLI